MGTTQTQQTSPTNDHSHQTQQMDLIGILATMVIALIVYIFNRNVNKTSEQFKDMMRLHEESEKKIDYAHDRITKHVEDYHTEKR